MPMTATIAAMTERGARRGVAIGCSVVACVGFVVGGAGVEGATATTTAAPAQARVARSMSLAPSLAWQLAMASRAHDAGCAAAAQPGKARCDLKVLRAPAAAPRAGTTCQVDEAAGYSPCNIQNAYKLTTLAKNNGGHETVAVVDAYDDPNAAGDLAIYRSAEGLPACTSASGCFQQVNQEGLSGDPPAGDMGWGQEISLDLDMVSAVCPNCHIILVEANSSGLGDLLSSVAEAVQHLGANVVSDSWGSGEFDGETGWDGDLDFSGIPITFSSGDGAYQAGVQYPSASQYVTSVGGTMLTPIATGRLWKETAWVTKPPKGQQPTQGSGSGCSAWEPKPPWQTDTGCSMRMTADVSAVAANVLSYDSYESGGGGWYYNFGTSVASPIVAGVYALAGNSASVTTPASIAYANPKKLYDIKSGSEGKCTPAYFCKAGVGYDGPTGLGSPHGDGGF
jgi:subtilase family serine protease